MEIIILPYKIEVKIKWDTVCKVLGMDAGHSKFCQDIDNLNIIFDKMLFTKLLLLIYYCYCFITFNYLGLEGWVGRNQGKGGEHVRQRNRMCEGLQPVIAEHGVTGHLIRMWSIYSILCTCVYISYTHTHTHIYIYLVSEKRWNGDINHIWSWTV